MQLSAFMAVHVDAIVAEWEAFAGTPTPAAGSMSQPALRGRHREVVMAIVAHMQANPAELEPVGASGPRDAVAAAAGGAASQHGALRQAAGVGLPQLVSEFHALRSGVVARWRRGETTLDAASAIEDLARFDAAVDQALADAVQRHSSDATTSRDLFLAVLGHDLRSPLQAIEMASLVLTQATLADATRQQVGMRVRRASKSMNRLITDLLDFTRSRLGRAIPIERSACDLRLLCEQALDDARASHSQHPFVHNLGGDLNLPVDPARLLQALSNLLNNAVEHGDPGEPVSLVARGDEDGVVLAVANSGAPIPPDALRVIFDPLVQGPATAAELDRRSKTSLGLGLFIVREIVRGHGGTIEVQSTAEYGTAFTVRLPRGPAQG